MVTFEGEEMRENKGISEKEMPLFIFPLDDFYDTGSLIGVRRNQSTDEPEKRNAKVESDTRNYSH